MIVGDAVVTDEKIIGDAIELLHWITVLGGLERLFRTQSLDIEFAACGRHEANAGRSEDRVTLCRHAALGTVDGIVEVVARKHDGKVEAVGNRVTIEIDFTLARTQADGLGKFGVALKRAQFLHARRNRAEGPIVERVRQFHDHRRLRGLSCDRQKIHRAERNAHHQREQPCHRLHASGVWLGFASAATERVTTTRRTLRAPDFFHGNPPSSSEWMPSRSMSEIG